MSAFVPGQEQASVLSKGPAALDPADVLSRAASLVASGWTQHANARDRSGNKVNGTSYTAVLYDAGEAIFVAAGTNDPAVLGPAFRAMTRVNGTPDLVGWNDTPGRTQAEVVNAFRTAARDMGSRVAPETADDGNGRSETQ